MQIYIVVGALIALLFGASYFGSETEKRRVCDMINQGIHNALSQPGGSYEMAPETVSYYAQNCREEEGPSGPPPF